MPGKDLPSFTFWDLLGSDKIGHWLFYGVLCFLIIKCSNVLSDFRSMKYHYSFGIILSILYGILMEIIQGAFFASRTADYKDIIADTIGVILAALLYKKLKDLPEKVYYLFSKSKN